MTTGTYLSGQTKIPRPYGPKENAWYRRVITSR